MAQEFFLKLTMRSTKFTTSTPTLCSTSLTCILSFGTVFIHVMFYWQMEKYWIVVILMSELLMIKSNWVRRRLKPFHLKSLSQEWETILHWNVGSLTSKKRVGTEGTHNLKVIKVILIHFNLQFLELISTEPVLFFKNASARLNGDYECQLEDNFGSVRFYHIEVYVDCKLLRIKIELNSCVFRQLFPSWTSWFYNYT